jgi:HlyD family type I secretion membrane fusion protein
VTVSAIPAPLPPLDLRRLNLIGGLTLGGFVFGFLLWAGVAPIDSAAVAPGQVVVEGNRKQVQHLEGGIVGELMVREGSTVKAGDALLRLDDTQLRATLDIQREQQRASAALAARAEAEIRGLREIRFPDWLKRQEGVPQVASLLDSQAQVFKARREGMDSQLRILDQRRSQQREEIVGLETDMRAHDRQIAIMKQEAGIVEDLLGKGYERLPRLLDLQRRIAEVEGSRGQILARIARANQVIGEIEEQKVNLRVALVNEASQKFDEERTRQAELQERIRAIEDVLGRLVLKAPVDGKVVNLKVFTVGGVLPPRESVMEIVPDGGALAVEAMISLTDIDVVHVGLPVQLRFVALNQRTVPMLRGKVLDVSADRLVDPRSGQAFYQARIVIDPDQPELKDVQLYPGMPVEALVVTGTRTLLQYLAKPLFVGLSRSMRED